MKKKTLLDASQTRRFNKDGYLIVRHPAIKKIKAGVHAELKVLAVEILKKSGLWDKGGSKIASEPFAKIFDWTIRNEKNNAVSRSFYELFPASSSIIGLVAEPFFNQISRELGVRHPIPSTLPVMRIDRPGEEKYLTPAHQDYWYSMLCENSITFWMPLLPVTEEMGYLSAVPCSHKLGILPIRPWTNENPFTVARQFAEKEYASLPVRDDEALVFYQLLVHRSASNTSDKARFTIQVRYNDLATLDAMTSSFTPKHSAYVIAAQQKITVPNP